MKYVMLSLFLIFTTFMVSMAQKKGPMHGDGPGQKIKAVYIAYMTQELNLTEEDAQKFWPIHAEFHNEMKAKHQQAIDELEKEESLLNIKKKYKEKFVRVIGEERANLFFRKDAEFRHKVSERIKDARNRKRGFQR